MSTDAWGQPVGFPVPGWAGCPPPDGRPLAGAHCRVERLTARHAAALHAAFAAAPDGRGWTYMPYGPFPDAGAYRAWVEREALGDDPLYYAIVPASGGAAGVASYLRIKPEAGVIEVGNIALAAALQRTTAATEAMYLMMRHAFDDLGYRRYEWKCDALNAASRAAAPRFGFAFEGIFRQALVYKGRNRDTAWYAIVDTDWPAIRTAFESWLAPENFDASGRQRRKLADFRR